MSSPSGISVVVVAYGSAPDLHRCLSTLSGCCPVLVVDNSSDPACAEAARATGASYFDAGRNLGFAAGVNRALDLLAPTTDDILLLNPDAVVEPAAVARLGACLRALGNEKVAAVAPRQHGHGGSDQQVSWPFPTPAGAWADALGLGRSFRRGAFLIGSVLLLRGSAIVDVGRLDERFFLYAEEADWQWRAHHQGWTVEVCDEVEVFHAGGGTDVDAGVRETLFHASAEALLRKWYGPRGWSSARLATIVGALVRAPLRRGEDRRRALRRAQLYLRGPMRAAAALDVR
ncbi:MAG: glycosyltransferase family 2 protein [Acidimicrobiales bacterium]